MGSPQARRLRRGPRRGRHDHPPSRRRARSPALVCPAAARALRRRAAGREGSGRSARDNEPRRADRFFAMSVAVLGPGGVGGLLAGLLERAGTPVVVVAREETATVISERGLRVDSVSFGELLARPRAVTQLEEPVDVLIVATKASGLKPALERIAVQPKLVLPLLNGLDHIAVLRERFGAGAAL